MERVSGTIRLSASDLVGHPNCGHLTHLDVAVANGALKRPQVWDPLLQILWERGARHERGFVDHLKAQDLGITVIEGFGVDGEAMTHTRAAMVTGVPIIVQGHCSQAGGWAGPTSSAAWRCRATLGPGHMKCSIRNSRARPRAAPSSSCVCMPI
jgi:uncharacterized protein